MNREIYYSAKLCNHLIKLIEGEEKGVRISGDKREEKYADRILMTERKRE